jgi:hypothetical protein
MMQAETIDSAHNANCRCPARSQHALFRFLFYNPGTTLRLAAKETGMTYLAARLAKHRLTRRPDISRLCPECFRPALVGLVCGSCGAELGAFTLPQGIRFEETSPVHSIQPLNGLGSATPYQGGRDSEGNWRPLKMQYGGRNIAHFVERPTDPLLERCRSLLWEELKGPMFKDGIVEEASRLLTREVSSFRARFPGLLRSKGLADQLVRNVVDLLRLRYPNRFAVSSPTPVLESEENTG